jgi:hypothetical protein
MPHCRSKEKNGEFYFGYDAVDRKVDEKDCLYENFKVSLSNTANSNYNELVDVLNRFFKYLYAEYLKQCSEHIDKEITYLSFPAKFTEPYKKILFEAAHMAGFKNVDGIDEPTAAIHAFLTLNLRKLQELKLINKNQEYTFMIIDMGAGTTDLAICKHDTGSNKTSILSVWPSADYCDYFGGSEVDSLIYNYFMNHIKQNIGNIPFSEKDYIRECKTWKDYTLPYALENGEDILEPSFMSTVRAIAGEISPLPKMNLQTFLSFTHVYFEKFPNMVNESLSETANKNKGFAGGQDIDFVVLTGGHSQWCFLPDMLMNKMDSFKEINLPKIRSKELIFRMELPGETVANGMVYKPMSPKFSTVAANNVWVRFIFGDDKQKHSEPIQVISIGDVLPKTSATTKWQRMYSATGKIIADLFNDSYDGACEFLVGKYMKTAQCYKKPFIAKPEAWDNFKIFVSSMFDFSYDVFKRKRELKVDFDINMDDKQMISLEGAIYVEGYQSKNWLNFKIKA